MPAFRARLDDLAEMTRTLYALFRLAETQPESFDDYRRLALSESSHGENRREAVLGAWPGYATASELQLGAETLLAELNQYPLADGAILCAGPLLDNFRIVGGLYITANQRDPATFRHCADQRSVDHWLDAVCESQVEYPEVQEALQEHCRPYTFKPSETLGCGIQS